MAGRTCNFSNQVTTVGSTSFTFNYNGNTLTGGGKTLQGLAPRDLYYSRNWQVIEERGQNPDTAAMETDEQYVWSLAYVDCLVLRDRDTDGNSATGNYGISGSGLDERLYAQQDANWNTTALVDTSGDVQEYFVYDPYGNVTVMDSSGDIFIDNYHWSYLHQGGRLDLATGLTDHRYRGESATLGRWMAADRQYINSPNLYDDCNENPVNYIDPTGQSWYNPLSWGASDSDAFGYSVTQTSEAGGLVHICFHIYESVDGGQIQVDDGTQCYDLCPDLAARMRTSVADGVAGANQALAAGDEVAADTKAVTVLASAAVLAAGQLELGSAGQTIPVIGRLSDTAAYADEPGYEIVNPAGWTPESNAAWIQAQIDAGSTFLLASPITEANILSTTNASGFTFFAEELSQILDAGYIWQGEFLVPP